MAKFTQSERILNLGKSLVELFLDHGRADMSTRWMAHYLAEKMTEAENEKVHSKRKKLKEECCEVIMDLWAKRNSYPGFLRPLVGLEEAVSVLKALSDRKEDHLSWNRFINYESGSGWGLFLKKTRKSMDKILEIILYVAATEDLLKKEKKWLKHKEFLTADETKFITYLDALLKEPAYHPSVVFVLAGEEKKKKVAKPVSPPDRLAQAFDKLESLLLQQQEYLEKLKAEKLYKTPSGKKKK